MIIIRNDGPCRTDVRSQVDVREYRVLCGDFRDVPNELLERPGRAFLPEGIRYAKGMFAARGLGTSMQPRIEDGWWLFFDPDVVGTRQGRLVLVEDQNGIGMDRYVLKKYDSEKMEFEDGTWRHGKIRLISLNPEHPDIILEEGGNYQICGWYVDQAPRIERVETFQYPEPTEE